jgi:hypothetical protein
MCTELTGESQYTAVLKLYRCNIPQPRYRYRHWTVYASLKYTAKGVYRASGVIPNIPLFWKYTGIIYLYRYTGVKNYTGICQPYKYREEVVRRDVSCECSYCLGHSLLHNYASRCAENCPEAFKGSRPMSQGMWSTRQARALRSKNCQGFV